jgi:excisionase family DNA binding protein
VGTKSKPLTKDEIARAFGDPAGGVPPILSPREFAAVLGLSVKTVYEWIAKGRLDGAFRKRGKHCLIWRDRADRRQPARRRQGRRGGPSLAEVDRILAALEEPDRTPVAVLAFTGMRSGELQRLKPDDVDLAGNFLHVVSRAGAETKTRQSREVPIHARLRPLLAALPRRARPWLFVAPPGRACTSGARPLNVKRLNERFLAALKVLGLPAGRAGGGYTLHSLRHAFETVAVNARIPQRVVDTWLGHTSDKSMAATYYRLSDEESQRFMREVPFGDGVPAADAGEEE